MLGETDQQKLKTLSEQFNKTVEEYDNMRQILEGKKLPVSVTAGNQAMKA